jgi:hypothetical protein
VWDCCGTGTLRCWLGRTQHWARNIQSEVEVMTTVRRFCCDDLLRFANVNVDHLTETVLLSVSLSLVGLLFDFWSSYPKNFQPMLLWRSECPLSGLVSSVTNLNLLWTLGSYSGVNTLDAHFWNVLGFSKVKKRVGYHFLQRSLELGFQND